jgi:hypothetical protein
MRNASSVSQLAEPERHWWRDLRAGSIIAGMKVFLLILLAPSLAYLFSYFTSLFPWHPGTDPSDDLSASNELENGTYEEQRPA